VSVQNTVILILSCLFTGWGEQLIEGATLERIYEMLRKT
jgi:hypothetical protein